MITRSDPSRNALSLRQAMDQLLQQSIVQPASLFDLPALRVPVDIRETANGYEVDVALPGVQPEDIDVIVDQNTLTIRGDFSYQNSQQDQSQDQGQGQRGGRRHHRRRGNYLTQEIVYGSFERTITLPRPIDVNNIQTSIQNGILAITLPYSEVSRPRQINVSGGQAQPGQVTAGAEQQQVTAGAGQQQGQQSGQASTRQAPAGAGQQKG